METAWRGNTSSDFSRTASLNIRYERRQLYCSLNSQRLQTTHVSNSCFLSCVTLQILDGEVYPPTVKEVGADMQYPPHVPDSHRFAVGHEAFGLVPGLMMYATIWLREHNRVCDVLKEVHPDWDDERLFQTTRLILIGEFMRL